MLDSSKFEHLKSVNTISNKNATSIIITTSSREFEIRTLSTVKLSRLLLPSELVEFCGVSVSCKVLDEDSYILSIDVVLKDHTPSGARLYTSPRVYDEKVCELEISKPWYMKTVQDVYSVTVRYLDKI